MDTKVCSHCKQELPATQFSWKIKAKNLRQSICRDCRSTYNRAYYSKNRDRMYANIQQYKQVHMERARSWIMHYLETHPCVDCGETDPIVLDFDHVSGEKAFNLSDAVVTHRVGIQKLADEIQHCVVRCANCHRRKTAIASGFWKVGWSKGNAEPFKRDCAGKRLLDNLGLKLKRGIPDDTFA